MNPMFRYTHHKSGEFINDHKLPIQQLCQRYHTNFENGLSEEHVILSLQRHGLNAFSSRKEISSWLRFLKHLFLGFSILLWVGAGLCLLLFYLEPVGPNRNDNLYIMAALILVVVITGIFSYRQEGKSSQIMQSFHDMIPETAKVKRSGKLKEILAKNIVVGDLIFVQGGDQIPADIRIIECHGLKVDNSAITGESRALERNNNVSDMPFLEAKNIIFSATSAIEGECKGVVIRIGDTTVMGQIAKLTGSIEGGKTTLGKDLHLFMKIVAIWAVCLGVSFFIVMLLIGYTWDKAVIFLITSVVSSVPEGLLTTLTLSLTLAAQRMAQRNCLVKKLEAVESMGSTSVICTDKTGTLTQNRMTVSNTWYDSKMVGHVNSSLLMSQRKRKTFHKLCVCAALCNNAEFKPFNYLVPVMRREVIGTPSEAAILKYVEIATRGGVKRIRTSHPRIFEMPFNSTNKYHVSIHLSGRKNVLLMKGAPERLMEYCSTILFERGEIEIDEEIAEKIEDACSTLAAAGKRVLAFCDKENFHFDEEEEFTVPTSGLRFLGLMAMVDPPRPNVPDAVLTCRKAGIKVIMVTGDHALTAQSIATQVHIISELSRVQYGMPQVIKDNIAESAIVLEGNDLLLLTEGELDRIILNYEEIVFARTSPKQKLNIVESCQRVGGIVAVTGDGVNDSPALKKADIGVAMGITGSAVSKQAADIVLLDDNFATVVHGIEEGRLVFDNLKKSIVYTLTHNIPEVFPFIIHVIFGIPSPLTIIAVLIIDLVTDMWPAIAFAYEVPEGDLMVRRPRNVLTERLVSFPLLFVVGHLGMIEVAAGFFSYFVSMAQGSWNLEDLLWMRKDWDDVSRNLTDSTGRKWEHLGRKSLNEISSSAFFAAIVVCQVTNTFICRSLRNTILQYKVENVGLRNAALISLSVSFILINVPGIYEVVEMRPLYFYTWVLPLPFCLLMLVFDFFRKLFAFYFPKHWLAENLIY